MSSEHAQDIIETASDERQLAGDVIQGGGVERFVCRSEVPDLADCFGGTSRRPYELLGGRLSGWFRTRTLHESNR
jgi:hypothetical protein